MKPAKAQTSQARSLLQRRRQAFLASSAAMFLADVNIAFGSRALAAWMLDAALTTVWLVMLLALLGRRAA